MRLLHSSQTAPGNRRPEIYSALASVSELRLQKWVEKISVPRHFEAQPDENQAAAKWLARQFEEWDYEVLRQGVYDNVVALPRKLSPEMILVGAHYDSTPETPGADDNGSAVATMLGCAEALAKFAPGAAVCFVAFNREEDGMLGSADFVEEYLPGAGFKIAQTHILEMVGFASYDSGSQRVPSGLPISLPDKGDFLGILANKKSGDMMNAILSGARTYLPELAVMALEVVPGAERAFPVLARSDHLPFWQRDLPAVMWTDTSEFRNANYHQATDTPETLDYGFLLLVTQLLVACVATEAERLRPAKG